MTTVIKGRAIPKSLPYGAVHTHARDISYKTPATEPGHLTAGRGAMPAGGMGESPSAGAMTAPMGSSGPNTKAGQPAAVQPWLSQTLKGLKPKPNP